MSLNNGKDLENLVALIQEALKDSHNTVIYTNAKLPNRGGRKREFDILIETMVSDFSIKIAIECKDYKRPVSVDKIEAFHGKCSRLPDINKKVFVSANGYQADAINAAKDFGIELFRVEEVDSAVIFKWFNITQLGLRYQVKDYKFGIDATDEELTLLHEQEDTVTFIYKGAPKDVIHFLNDSIKEAAIPVWNINILEMMRGKPIGMMTNIPYKFTFVSDAFIQTKNNRLFPVSELFGSIDTMLVKSKADNVTSKSFTTNDKSLAQYISFDDGKYGKAEIILTADKRKFFHVDLDGNRVELTELGIYDPKTDTYTSFVEDRDEG